MGQSQSTEDKPSSGSPAAGDAGGGGAAGDAAKKQPACKACCACPETKKARDACIMEKGEENCGELIEAHKKCMRDMGFNI